MPGQVTAGPLGASEVNLVDSIWNRAALEGGGVSPRDGDRALAAVLLAHGYIMNGGFAHALEGLSDAELEAAKAGYRYFGFTRVVDLFSAQPEDEEEERLLDDTYSSCVPDDSTLESAFRRRYLESPFSFAPTA